MQTSLAGPSHTASITEPAALTEPGSAGQHSDARPAENPPPPQKNPAIAGKKGREALLHFAKRLQIPSLIREAKRQQHKHDPTQAATVRIKEDWAKNKINSNGGDLKGTLYSVLKNRQGPDAMINELTDMIEHSTAFRRYLGIASPRTLERGGMFQRSASFEKLNVAPLVLARGATLKIKESRAERALAELEKLLARPDFMCEAAAGDALFLLASRLLGSDFSSRLADRAAGIIFNNLNSLLRRDGSRVLQACSRLSETSTDESATLRQLGQEFVENKASDQAAHIDRGGRNGPMDPVPENFDKLSTTSQLVIREAKQRGIEVGIVNAEREKFTLHRAGITYEFNGALAGLAAPETAALFEGKDQTAKFLASKGIKVPAQHVFDDDWPAALAFMGECKAVVVKPARGTGGGGISVKVSTEKDLKSAIAYAKNEISSHKRKRSTGEGATILIEEYQQGEDLRLLVINYELRAAATRRPAEVTGHDGLTVRALIEERNDQLAVDTAGQSRIPLDRETERCLGMRHLGYNSVLEDGLTVRVRENANVRTGGTMEDVTGTLHAGLRDAAETIAKYMQVPLVGLDFLVESPENGEYVVIEANESPALGNHEPQPVARYFIDMLYPATADDPT
jgi:D-alanine-D-alanine ligase-like ATP-grasp enzyme